MTSEQQQLLQTVIEKALSAHVAARSIDWGKVLETAFGTLGGALIALAGVYLQLRWSYRTKLEEEKRAREFTSQQWFENEYIDNGVMALYQRVLYLNSQTVRALSQADVVKALRAADDTKALARCQEILGEDVIGIWHIMERLYTVFQVEPQVELNASAHEYIGEICSLMMTELPKLRDALVKCRVRNKGIVRLLKEVPPVLTICTEFGEKSNAIFNSAKRYLDERV